jgi:tetratricopeptide (TPR) repeat protein
LNQQGQLVGIHGASKARFVENQGIDPESGVKYGLNLGIPIDTFLRLAPQVNPALKFPAALPVAVSPQLTASDIVIQAVDQLILGKTKEALNTVERAIRLQPNYTSAYLARGFFYAEDQNFPSAIADLDQAIRLNPNSFFAYYYRGIARYGAKDYLGARADYEQAIRLNPNNALAYYGRGLVRYESQDPRGAIADFDEAIRLNSAFTSAYLYRALALIQSGDKRGGLAALEQAIRLNPNNASAYNFRGFYRAQFRDNQGAIADYDQAIRLNPNEAIYYNNRAPVRLALQDHQGAIADHDQAIRLNSNDARFYNNRAFTRYKLKDYMGSMVDYDQAIRLNPSYTFAYGNRAFTRFKLGDKQGALADLQRAAELAKAQGDQRLYKAYITNINTILTGGKLDCYIATASLQTGGSEARLNLLRNWRDQVLRQTVLGQWLAGYYEQIAPRVASKVATNLWLRSSFLFPFVMPAIWLTQQRISHPQFSGIYDVGLYAILLLMLTYSSACYGFFRLADRS